MCVYRERACARVSCIKPHVNGKLKIYSSTHTKKKKESKHNTKDSRKIKENKRRSMNKNPKQLTKWQYEHTYQ